MASLCGEGKGNVGVDRQVKRGRFHDAAEMWCNRQGSFFAARAGWRTLTSAQKLYRLHRRVEQYTLFFSPVRAQGLREVAFFWGERGLAMLTRPHPTLTALGREGGTCLSHDRMTFRALGGIHIVSTTRVVGIPTSMSISAFPCAQRVPRAS